MVAVFRQARRVLRDDGTLWLNLGDSYNAYNGNRGTESRYAGERERFEAKFPQGHGLICKGLKQKDLIGIPWMVAFALRDDGWYLRSAIPWIKRNSMPESCKDRPTTSIETIFLFSKSVRCYYDNEAIKKPPAPDSYARKKRGRKQGHKWEDGPGSQSIFNDMSKSCDEDGRERRSTDWFFESWQGLLTDEDGDPLAFVVNTSGFKGAHFATFPPKLVEPIILAGCPEGGVVLDPFTGSGTTGEVALKHFRRFVGIELNPTYANEIAIPRIEREATKPKQVALFN